MAREKEKEILIITLKYIVLLCMGLITMLLKDYYQTKSFGVNIETLKYISMDSWTRCCYLLFRIPKKEYDLVFFQKKSIEIKTISIFSLFMLGLYFSSFLIP